MTNEEAIGNLTHAIRWNDMPKKEALDMAMKALEQQPCEDAISRQAVISTIYDNKSDFKNDFAQGFFADRINDLPPVTPQPKIGRWIEHPHEAGENWEFSRYECSECHVWADDDSDYCPNCGVKMKEVEE